MYRRYLKNKTLLPHIFMILEQDLWLCFPNHNMNLLRKFVQREQEKDSLKYETKTETVKNQ